MGRKWHVVRVSRYAAVLVLAGLMVPYLVSEAPRIARAAAYDVPSFDISNGSTAEVRPRVDRGYVVWQDYRNNSGAAIAENANANIYMTRVGDSGNSNDNSGSGDEDKINPGSNNAKRPDIYDRTVVWTQDGGVTGLDVRGDDVRDDDRFVVDDSSGDQDFPAISGNVVVYQDNRDGNWDIRGYRIDDDENFKVITNSDNQTHPAIDGNLVVWVDDRDGSSNPNIFGKDLDSGDTFRVSSSDDARDPAVSGDRVVYVDGDVDEASVWLWNRDDDSRKRLNSSRRHGRANPRIDGDIVVWADERDGSGHWDIWGYDLATDQEFPVNEQSDDQTNPDVSDTDLVWQDESRNGDIRGGQLEISGIEPTSTNTPNATNTPQATVTPGPPAPRDQRFFFQTGFRIDSDVLFDYFQKRGGVRTFGYPISRTFRFLGFATQFFQRQVVQIGPDGNARALNLLDPGLMPVNRINQSTFPPFDAGVANAAPLPGTPNYDLAIIDFIRNRAPETFNGQPVRFFSTFNSFVTCSDAFPFTQCEPALLPLLNLEMVGSVTSNPMADPGNQNFIYQRFQRQILHFDSSCQCTQPILLADWFKSVITGRNLPSDLDQEMQGTSFYRQYNNGAPLGMNRPEQLPETNMQNAFEPQ